MTAAAVTAKAKLRQQLRQRRLELMTTAEAPLQALALEQLPPRIPPGRHLGLYWPLAGEADLRPLAACPSLAGRIALPRVQGGQMHYHRWQPGDSLSPDDTAIQAPVTGPALRPEQLALLLAPALAFDRHGIRLGYGGGWFDRLRADPAWRAIPAVAVLPRGCLLEALPRDPWDVPFQGWLDETGLHGLAMDGGTSAWLQAV
jgi:5-formyltetrahydrofolate cyclo-ligase